MGLFFSFFFFPADLFWFLAIIFQELATQKPEIRIYFSEICSRLVFYIRVSGYGLSGVFFSVYLKKKKQKKASLPEGWPVHACGEASFLSSHWNPTGPTRSHPQNQKVLSQHTQVQTQRQNRSCHHGSLLLPPRGPPAALLVQKEPGADVGEPASGTHWGRGDKLRGVLKKGLPSGQGALLSPTSSVPLCGGLPSGNSPLAQFL